MVAGLAELARAAVAVSLGRGLALMRWGWWLLPWNRGACVLAWFLSWSRFLVALVGALCGEVGISAGPGLRVTLSQRHRG
jgi:hypothetical protein